MAERRYCAFISYRHADNIQEGRRWAEWLHRALERYVVPPDLVGQPNLRGEPIRQSLYPIFRDEDELPANADLATGIRTALEASDYMIVLCSPRSAVSPWVRKEVREFKELGRSDRILAAMVAGEPNADDPAKARDGIMRDEECFCEELRFGSVGPGGIIDWSSRTEPIAADLRPAGTRAEGYVTAEAYREYLTFNSSHAPERITALTDAYRQRLDHGLLKIIAGLLGVALGTLVDRDAAHRAELARKELSRAEAEATRLRKFSRRLAAAGAVALVLAVMAGLFWWRSAEARKLADQRGIDLAAEAKRATGAEQEATLRSAEATSASKHLRLTLSVTDQQIGHLLAEQGRYGEALVYDARALSNDENACAIADSTFLLEHKVRLPAAVLQHGSAVISAAFSSDGTRILTASWDNTVRIWDAVTGKPIGEPMKHKQQVVSAAFSPDGTRVVTASIDDAAQLWDAATGKALGEPMRHQSFVTSAEFSPDGKRVVTASFDSTARVWDATTGKPIGDSVIHQDEIQSASFSPDGTRVLTVSGGWSPGGLATAGGAHDPPKAARLWDAATGKPVTEPMLLKKRIESAAFSPDGSQVVTASDDHTAQVWDARTGKPEGHPLRHQDIVWTARFSPDGTRVVTASEDKTAQLWNASTGNPLGDPMRHEKSVKSAEFSAEGTRIVTASEDATARLWDAATAKPLGEPLRHASQVFSATFSPDGRRIVTASMDNTARSWDYASGEPLDEPIRSNDLIRSAAFSPDGKRVVTAESGFEHRGNARVWDIATFSPLGTPMQHDNELTAVAFSPDGTRVVTASSDKTARVWDATTGKPLSEPMHHEAKVCAVAFSPDGTMLVTASEDHTARLWAAATGKPLSEPMQHQEAVRSCAFSADGRRIVTSSDDLSARVWDSATGKPLAEPMRHQGAVRSAAFNHNGTRVVTASRDKTAQIWDAASGKQLGEPMQNEFELLSAAFNFDGTHVITADEGYSARIWDAVSSKAVGEPMHHLDEVRSAASNSNGTLVVTASNDSTVRLWDATTGKPLCEPMRHSYQVQSAAFSPDGNRVISVSADRTVRIWDVAMPLAERPRGFWLGQLNELAAHAHFGSGGAVEPLGAQWQPRRDALRRDLAAAPTQDASLAKAIGWFLADPRHRTISPLSTETTDQWIIRRNAEFTTESLQQAFTVEPTDALCLARRGRDFAMRESPDLYWAELYSKLAIKLAAPISAAATEAAWRRVAVLVISGNAAEGAALADRTRASVGANVWAWEAKWEACLLLHRDAEAADTRRVADALAEKMFWYNKQSYDERVKEAEAAVQNSAATKPAK